MVRDGDGDCVCVEAELNVGGRVESEVFLLLLAGKMPARHRTATCKQVVELSDLLGR